MAANGLVESFRAGLPCDMTPQQTGAACKVDDFMSSRSHACIVHWCQAPTQSMNNGSLAGRCWHDFQPKQISDMEGNGVLRPDTCSNVTVHTRVAAPSDFPLHDWADMWAGEVTNLTGVPAQGNRLVLNITALPPLALEDWETGQVHVTAFFDSIVQVVDFPLVQYAAREPNATLEESCEIHAVCFYGTPECKLPGWRDLGWHSLASRQPPQSSSAKMVEGKELQVVPEDKRMDVVVMFGLQVAKATPLVGIAEEQWTFDPDFAPENPWAQRAMATMCVDLPKELLVIEATCWIRNFQAWLLSSASSKFPSRSFDIDVVQWYNDEPSTALQHVWMLSHKVRASKFVFVVNMRRDAEAVALLEYMGKWDAYISLQNALASETANSAWHTSTSWVRAEAESVIGSNAKLIVFGSVVGGGVGVFVFSWDMRLAIIVFLLSCLELCGIAFFIVAIMGWYIGPVETMALAGFVGYAATYQLQLVFQYVTVCKHDLEIQNGEVGSSQHQGEHLNGVEGSDLSMESMHHRDVTATEVEGARLNHVLGDLRIVRTRLAVVRVGGSTISWAIAMIGSSSFLLFCRLKLFSKMGIVIIATSVLSIAITSLALPAALMAFGPGPAPPYKHLVARTAISAWARIRRCRC